MGAHIGRNVEIMQMVWLDHFRPELVFVGDNTLIGAFSRLTVHAYEGCGKFRYGLIEIGAHCTIGAGTGIGPIRIEDNVRTLPGTTTFSVSCKGAGRLGCGLRAAAGQTARSTGRQELKQTFFTFTTGVTTMHIHVANLPREIDEKKLAELFKPYGPLASYPDRSGPGDREADGLCRGGDRG